MSAFYTYMHLRGDTGKPFYIGKGTGARASNPGGRNRHWHNIVNAHGRTIQILAQWDTNAEAIEHEKVLIASFRSMGVELANVTDGGEGTAGRRLSEDAKRRISVANTGKVPSDKQRLASSLRWKGVPKSAEHVAKMSAANLGKKRSQAVIDSYLPALRAAMANPQVRERISAAARARPPVTAEAKARMSAAQTGRKASPETRKRISDGIKAAIAAKRAVAHKEHA